MKHNYIIAPIKTVEHEIDDKCLYIFCSQREDINGIDEDEVLWINVLDTEVEDHQHRFRVEHAVLILEHIQSFSSKKDIFICCDSGESRSTAVCAALVEMEGGDSTYIWEDKRYHPNSLVYHVMKETIENINEGKIYLGNYGLLLCGQRMKKHSDIYAVAKSEMPGELVMLPWESYERICNDFRSGDLKGLRNLIMRTSLGIYTVNGSDLFWQIDDILEGMGIPGDMLDATWDKIANCWKIRNPKIYRGA